MSTGLLEPWTTLVAVLLWVVLAAAALWGVRRRALWSFGLLWYLVGHSLESSLVSLELVFEHRNYLPSLGVLFAVAYYLVWGLERLSSGRRLAYPVVGLLVVVLAFTTFTRAGIWANKITLNTFTAKNHPDSYRSLTGTGHLSIIDRRGASETFAAFGRAAAARDSTIVPMVEMIKIAAGLRVMLSASEGYANSDPAPKRDPALIERPLKLSVPYMAVVESLLDEQIRNRLERFPVSAESVYALENVRDCMSRRVDVCIPLEDELNRWYDIAANNPRMQPIDRGLLYMSRGRFHAQLGEVERAIEFAREAVHTDPENLAYPVNLATLHMRLGEWDEVASIIEELESRLSWSGFGSQHISWLRAHYRNYQQAKRADVQ